MMDMTLEEYVRDVLAQYARRRRTSSPEWERNVARAVADAWHEADDRYRVVKLKEPTVPHMCQGHVVITEELT